MLPGFRFFVATIVLAASILIFGLGAAALLRATHEEVAAAPSLRTIQPPVPLRPRQIETAPPTLALLRVEIPAPVSEDLPPATETAATPPADEPKPVAEAVIDATPSEPAPAQESPTAQTDAKASEESNKPASTEAAAPEPASAAPTANTVAIAAAPAPEAASTPPQAASPVEAASVSPPAPAVTAPAPAAAIEVAERAAPAEATAPAPTPIPPTPIAVGGAPVIASPPAASEPTRVVAVTATGCEILPTAPGQPVAIPEAARAAQQPAQGSPAPNDKTANLDPAPTGTIPTPVARPQRITRTIRKRPVVIRHRHHAPRTRVVRREVIRPQPQPDLFTLLFGGGQPAPVTQPTR